MRIAVAGGTGTVGRPVVAAAQAAGHQVTVLSRSHGIDVTTGQGLDAALDGVASVIDVTNRSTTKRRVAVEFFERASMQLLEAGRRAGVAHHVVLSIVGADRVDLGYYAGKRRQEEAVLGSGGPVTVLRATQFHEFAEQLIGRGPGRLVLVPRMRSQPIAAVEVADALVALATGPPQGRAPELAGPEPREMPDLVRLVLRARGVRRVVLPLRVPGAAGRAMAAGALLPTEPGPRGRQTFEQWLAGSVAAQAGS